MNSAQSQISYEAQHQDAIKVLRDRPAMTADEIASIDFVQNAFQLLMGKCGTLHTHSVELQARVQKLEQQVSQTTKEADTVAGLLKKAVRQKKKDDKILDQLKGQKKKDDELVEQLRSQKKKDDNLVDQLERREEMLKARITSLISRHQHSCAEVTSEINSVSALFFPDGLDEIEATVAKALQDSEVVAHATRTPPPSITTTKLKTFGAGKEKGVSFVLKENLQPSPVNGVTFSAHLEFLFPSGPTQDLVEDSSDEDAERDSSDEDAEQDSPPAGGSRVLGKRKRAIDSESDNSP